MIDREKPRGPRILREIPLGTKMHDPWVAVNLSSSQTHIFVNRDLGATNEPRRVMLKPGQYFRFPHMNYNMYADPAPPEGQRPEPFDMLKGKSMQAFLRKIPYGLREARAE